MSSRSLFAGLALAVVLVSCSKVPITKRKQMNLLPESQLVSLSLTNYQVFLMQNPPVKGTADAALVQKVGTKVADAVIKFMNQNKMGDRIKGYQWEFNLVNSPDVKSGCPSSAG